MEDIQAWLSDQIKMLELKLQKFGVVKKLRDKIKQVDSSLSKNQALISETTVIIITIKYIRTRRLRTSHE